MVDEITKQDLVEMEQRLRSQMEQVETRLLSAFHGWARSMEIRVRGVSVVSSGVDERLSLLEDRESDLECKKGA